jgi:hypothetical protein
VIQLVANVFHNQAVMVVPEELKKFIVNHIYANSYSEVTYLFSKVLEICAILIGFQWAMHFLVQLGAVVSRNTFCLDVIKEMG